MYVSSSAAVRKIIGTFVQLFGVSTKVKLYGFTELPNQARYAGALQDFCVLRTIKQPLFYSPRNLRITFLAIGHAVEPPLLPSFSSTTATQILGFSAGAYPTNHA